MLKTQNGDIVGTQVFLRIGDVVRVTGLPVPPSMRWSARVPSQKVRLSPRAVAWVESEVSDWQQARIAQREAAQ